MNPNLSQFLSLLRPLLLLLLLLLLLGEKKERARGWVSLSLSLSLFSFFLSIAPKDAFEESVSEFVCLGCGVLIGEKKVNRLSQEK